MVPNTFGSDFEFGLVDKKGRVVPAPLVLTDGPVSVEGGTLHPDGCACELSTRVFFNGGGSDLSFENMCNHVQSMGFRSVHYDVLEFDADLIGYHPDNDRIGCKPWVNVYTGKESVPSEYTSPVRYQGFHIHMGWSDVPSQDFLTALCKSLEIGLALYRKDDNPERNKLYGNAGDARWKSYGVELRSPSARLASLLTPSSLNKLINEAVARIDRRVKLVSDEVWQGIWNTVDARELDNIGKFA